MTAPPVPLRLGDEPAPLEVTLVAGGDFRRGLRRDDGTPWPAGSTLTLVIGETRWVAQYDGPDALWTAETEEVAALIATAPRTAQILYREDDFDEVAYAGSVHVR